MADLDLTDGFSNIVSAVILKEQQFLLGLRKNTSHYAGYWSLVVGHVEQGESNEIAIVREMKEELGIAVIKIKPIQFHIDQQEKIRHQVFQIEQWQGEIVNREPALCEAINWFPADSLPQNTTPISRTIVKQFISNQPARENL